MHCQLFTLATVALLAICALAAPTPSKSLTKRTFSVPVKSRNGVVRSPQQELQRTFARMGWEIIVFNPSPPWASSGFPSSPFSSSASAIASAPVPTSSSALSGSNSSTLATSSAPASSATGNLTSDDATASTTSATAAETTTASPSSSEGMIGQVSAVPEANDAEYLMNVRLGTSPQTLNLDFDTGSADLWVFSASLPSDESSGHTTFNTSKSSTWTDYSAGSWEISYGDGSSASGTVGYDTVNIGGATATKQAVELATSVSGSFVDDIQSDGLVGLAFKTINTIQPEAQSTFFENVQDQLETYVFTANLKTSGGLYTFGEIDSSQYSGDIHYTDINTENGFWQFDSNTYTIGGSEKQCSTCSPAIADTGTSLLLVDDDVATAYYNQVSSASFNEQQGGYVYDCSESLPSFGVAIGNGYTATLTSSDLTYANLGDGSCFGGIQSNQDEGIQIFGDILLKAFFAVFDGANTRFGIADKA